MRIRYEDGPLREVFIAALHSLPQPVAPKTDQRIQVLNQKKRSGPGGD
jgi:hypothetical protein